MPPTPAHMAYQDQSGDLHLMADFAPVTALTIFYIIPIVTPAEE